MLVLHATWSGGRLWLWGEDGERVGDARRDATVPAEPAPHSGAESDAAVATLSIPDHWFAATADALTVALSAHLQHVEYEVGQVPLRLPAHGEDPVPSPRLANLAGLAQQGADDETPAVVTEFTVAGLAIQPGSAHTLLERLLDLAQSDDLEDRQDAPLRMASSIDFWAAAARLVQTLLAQQRFVPLIRQHVGGDLKGFWAPWFADQPTRERVAKLLESMPAVARCARDPFNNDAWPILEDFLSQVTDAHARQFMIVEDMQDAIADRLATSPEMPVVWLGGLFTAEDALKALPAVRQELVRRVRVWVGALEERGPSSLWRLCVKLQEPEKTIPGATKIGGKVIADEAEWVLSFHVQSVDRPTLVVDAADLWLVHGESITVEGKRIDEPRELLLGELARAARIYKRLDKALEETEPAQIELNTKQAYEFLREIRPLLLEQGFGVLNPEWWDSPAARVGARLRIESDTEMPSLSGGLSGVNPQMGLGSLVKYRWEIAVGDLVLSLQEFEQLAQRKSPLVQIGGKWIEIRPEDVEAAIRFIRENPGGEMKLSDALRIAYGSDPRDIGISILGIEASGWVEAFLNSEAASQKLEILTPPEAFHGTLRPYQLRGMSWLVFQERLGFGVCLADDMGLGKTIQLLALMAWERQQMSKDPSIPRPKPTLLIVPMSVVGNWIHETRRFCPELTVLQHHGAERRLGDAFLESATKSDIVITTYGLAHRDRELIEKVEWGRIVLDEAQYIKNPTTKQAAAVRAFKAERKVCLTGTPVENRLSELWSILDFLNPGYLGTAGSFRQRFAVPIERYRDKARAESLRGLIRPFVLRRLKTDPTVIADLPEKLESKEYSHLTTEQASLYESCVRRMMNQIENSEGIQRRGVVLAALIKLKQICNHPSQLLKDTIEGTSADPARSGKCIRLLEMLDEVLAEGDQALVFTQFRQMGNLLHSMIRKRFDREVLFLHGQNTLPQRQAMVENFQKGKAPVLLLSLKAGGVGLNLTAATHVFHFDRWWNPAVESQATDRAYRIGQTRKVQVHKFVVRGTLEERIDQMIESKTELAQNIIGDGERWLTELSSDQLRDILTLRNDAVGDDL
jgi:SNF2 family DNA or RNA helicase